ncbi:hypothetical protein Ancab_014773 [Ancistrocladus abbreviatus]
MENEPTTFLTKVSIVHLTHPCFPLLNSNSKSYSLEFDVALPRTEIKQRGENNRDRAEGETERNPLSSSSAYISPSPSSHLPFQNNPLFSSTIPPLPPLHHTLTKF